MYRDFENPALLRAVLGLTAPLRSQSSYTTGRARLIAQCWSCGVPATRTYPCTTPRVEVVILDDSGHWLGIDHPVAVEEPVLRFPRVVTGDHSIGSE